MSVIASIIAQAAPAAPAAGQTQQGGSPLFMIGMMVFMFGFMYLFMIRPQKKQQEEHAKAVAALTKDDKVILAGGIHASIISIEDSVFTVQIADKVNIKVDKSGITTIIKPVVATEVAKK